jgi:hypothetical protein
MSRTLWLIVGLVAVSLAAWRPGSIHNWRPAGPVDSLQIKEVILTEDAVGEVEFPHLEHVDDFGIECDECHHEINAAALDIPHEDYFEDFWIDCETCHGNGEPTREAVSCAECHHDQPGELSDETLSSKVVIHKSCWTCHEIGTGSEASSECVTCHSGPKKPFIPAAPID